MRLRLLSLLHGDEMLLLLLDVLRLPMRHLLKMHLQIHRSHAWVPLHRGDLRAREALRAIGE